MRKIHATVIFVSYTGMSVVQKCEEEQLFPHLRNKKTASGTYRRRLYLQIFIIKVDALSLRNRSGFLTPDTGQHFNHFIVPS